MTVYNVKDYGAIGNGIANDTAAILQAANDLINSAYGGTLLFPAGIYICGQQINLPKSCNVKGESYGNTEVRFTNIVPTLKGFRFVGSDGDPARFFSVQDLRITTNTSGGIAIHIDNPVNLTVSAYTNYIVKNVFITGLEVPAWWDIGCRAFNASYSTIENLHYEGSKWTPNAKNNYYAGIAIQIDSTPNDMAAVNIETKIKDCSIHYCEKGIELLNTVEGVYITNCNIVMARKGIQSSRGSYREPWLVIHNNHIAGLEHGILMDGMWQSTITGNHIAKPSDNLPGTSGIGWVGIHANFFSDLTIANNMIMASLDTKQGAGQQNGMVFFEGDRAMVSNNILLGGFDSNWQQMITGIWLTSSARNCKVTYNQFHNVGSPVINQGSNNVIV